MGMGHDTMATHPIRLSRSVSEFHVSRRGRCAQQVVRGSSNEVDQIAKTIEVLRNQFAIFGIPEQLVSDNGSQFMSEEFQVFMKVNGIKHITSAPYHPATNGLAERAVQTFKKALRSTAGSIKPLEERLAKFLMAYRNTPHSTTGESPAQLMLGRPLRTGLDLQKPNFNRKMVNKQHEQSMLSQ